MLEQSATGSGELNFDKPTRTLSGSIQTEGLTGPATAADFFETETPTILSDEAFEQLMDGGHYLNVHSTRFPNGEVRGQVEP